MHKKLHAKKKPINMQYSMYFKADSVPKRKEKPLNITNKRINNK